MKTIIIRLILLACLVLSLLTVACHRSSSEESRGKSGIDATHPWELPVNSSVFIRPGAGNKPQLTNQDGEVVIPQSKGPILSKSDLFNSSILPGSWVMICRVLSEQMNIDAASQYSTMVFQQNGNFRLNQYANRELGNTVEGNWTKEEPGYLTMYITNQQGQQIITRMNAEMFGNDFLYLWYEEARQGFWLARQSMDEPYAKIDHNRYETNRGELLMSNVGLDSYSGELTTSDGSVWTVSGYLVDGILNAVWTDKANQAAGFGAFIIRDNWTTLDGVIWRDDYEDLPFSQQWTGRKIP